MAKQGVILMQTSTITVGEEAFGIIGPALHGQFIEELGSCIDGGVWVGEDSPIPRVHGLRRDIVDALAALQPPVIRWPGGCYADMYHWRDGVGPRADRPVSFNENFGTFAPDAHQMGTHEFMELCRLVGAEPWLNVNLVTGTAQEMKDWMEYCNRESGTDLARERAKNGHPEPFRVRYWGIGNEAWDGGGKFTAQGYAAEYRKYSTAAPSFRKDFGDRETEPLRLILSGPDGNKPRERVRWTRDLFRAFGEYRCPPFYGVDLHFYNWNLQNPEETETRFTREDWDRVVRGCFELEDVINEQYTLIREGLAALPEPEGPFPAGERRCALLVGEWGNWHGCAFGARPALFQQVSMRDAVTTALTLDIFHRNCDKVAAACVAQTVNVLNSLFLTQGERFLKTPNYDVFEMYQPHRGAEALSLQTEGGTGGLHSFASRKGNSICINLVNAGYDASEEAALQLPPAYTFRSGRQLASADPTDANTWDAPDLVRARDFAQVRQEGGAFCVSLPPASVTVLRFDRETY